MRATDFSCGGMRTRGRRVDLLLYTLVMILACGVCRKSCRRGSGTNLIPKIAGLESSMDAAMDNCAIPDARYRGMTTRRSRAVPIHVDTQRTSLIRRDGNWCRELAGEWLQANFWKRCQVYFSTESNKPDTFSAAM